MKNQAKSKEPLSLAVLLNSLPTHANPSIKCMSKWARDCRQARVFYSDEKESRIPNELVLLLDNSIMAVTKVTSENKSPFEDAICDIKTYLTRAALEHLQQKEK